jgi:hypothetical protein
MSLLGILSTRQKTIRAHFSQAEASETYTQHPATLIVQGAWIRSSVWCGITGDYSNGHEGKRAFGDLLNSLEGEVLMTSFLTGSVCP